MGALSHSQADLLALDESVLAALSAEALGEKLADPIWRLCNLYWIRDKHGRRVRFRPNDAQLQLLDGFWFKNLILKARQMGFTTFIQIVITDRIVFVPDTRAGVIAHRLEDCEVILRDKIKFAYEQLPAVIQAAVPIVTDNESELMLANGSSVRVSTSLRSATLQILHISEFGKICAKNPYQAREIITGTLPAIELGNLVFIESTAEGAEGEFFRMVQEAQALQQQGQDLSEADYKLHFFAWWQAAEYQLDPRGVIISDKEHEYFDTLEAVIGYRVSMRQRAWYVKKARELGDIENMWQEYPSTPEEAFKVSMGGCYYTRQIAQARMEGRFAEKIPVQAAPVNTFWDLGADDQTAIWFHQQVGLEHRLIGYYEASGEDLAHFVRYLQDSGHVFGKHYLPHDAAHKRLNDRENRSIEDMLYELGLCNTVIVPRIPDILTGIQAVRTVFPHLWFDMSGCKEGIRHLELYRREWDSKAGVWRSRPRHDEHSNGADALRQLAQVFDELRRAGEQQRLQGQQGALAAKRGRRKSKANWLTA